MAPLRCGPNYTAVATRKSYLRSTGVEADDVIAVTEDASDGRAVAAAAAAAVPVVVGDIEALFVDGVSAGLFEPT